MHRLMTISTAADDRQLLTTDEMRAIAGVSDASLDTELAAMGLQVAAAIAAECNIAVASGYQPTLLQETVVETLRQVWTAELWLARRHDVAVTSIVEDGTTLTASDYLVDAESGELTRLSADLPTQWTADKLTITYQAGFASDSIPDDLKMAASDFFRLAWLEKDRDPSLRAREVDVEGVERMRSEYWVGAVPGRTGEGPVPAVVSGQLKRFRNGVF